MELNRGFFVLETNASTKALKMVLTEGPKRRLHKGDESRHVDSWFMMSSIWPAAGLTAAYLYFVILAGPKLMESRKPYNLKLYMVGYNSLQVAFSSWFVIKGIKETYGIFLKGACTPNLLNPRTTYEVDSLAWYYMMSKYIEFLDTVFFILRRKWSQVTFLHVYHHANMAIFTWVFVKYISGIQIFMIGLCNCFVHAVMYSYYLLAAFGPSISKFLWWKRYLTGIQIIQFMAIIVFMAYLYLKGCNTPFIWILFTIFNCSSFLVLFLLFYVKTYKRKKVE